MYGGSDRRKDRTMTSLRDSFWETAERFPAGVFRKRRTRVELIEETAALKVRFLECRAKLEAATEGTIGATAAAIVGAVELVDLTTSRMLPVVNDPATVNSTIGADVVEARNRLRERFREFKRRVPRALITMKFAEAVDSLFKIMESMDEIIVQKLALLYRERVSDFFGGLDAEAAYPSYHYSALSRSRVSAFRAAPAEDATLWATKIGALIWPSAIVDRRGNLYTGHADGEFVSLAPDVSVRWRIHDSRMMYIDSTGALGKDGFLYMASTDVDENGNQNQGRIWKIDPKDGRVLWQFYGRHFEDLNKPDMHLASFFEGNLTLSEEGGRIFIYAGSDDNRLYKIDSDGNLVWDYYTDTYPAGVIWTKPLLSPDGDSVFAGTLACDIHAVDTKTGARRWVRRVGGAVSSSPAMGEYGEMFFGCFDGRVYAIAPEDGTVFWTYQTMGMIYGSPAITGAGDVVIGSDDGGVYCLDRFGRRKWVYRTDAPIKCTPVIAPDGLIYIGNQNGKLYCISPGGRRVWSLHTNAGVAENDLNASPTFGPDGTIYFGSTTGEVFAVPRDYYFRNRQDERLCFAPGDDALRPGIPAGGEAIVLLDRCGAPLFQPPADISIESNLNLALFAVDHNGDVCRSELYPDSVNVAISPELPHRSMCDSRLRYIYIIPDGFMEYDTDYSIKVSGKYEAEGELRAFNTSIDFHTAARTGDGFAFTPTDAGTPGIIIKGFALSTPKEIDALAQAALDAHNYALAPVYVNDEKGFVVVAGCGLVDTGGGYEFAAKAANKIIATGVFKDEFIKFTGKARINAQGANVYLDSMQFAGRLTDEPGIANGSAYARTSIHNMPDFVDLLRVMKMADEDDMAVAFLTYTTLPFADESLEMPRKLKIGIEQDSDIIRATFGGAKYMEAEHWVHIVMIDTEKGRLIDNNRVEVRTEADGAVSEVISTVPADVQKGSAVAVLVLDLFPAAVIDI